MTGLQRLIIAILLGATPWLAAAAPEPWTPPSPPAWHPIIEDSYEIHGSFAAAIEPGAYARKDHVDNSLLLHPGVTRLHADLVWQSSSDATDLDLVLASPKGRHECPLECAAALHAKTTPPGFYADFEGGPGFPDTMGAVTLDATRIAHEGCHEGPCTWRASVHVDGAAADVAFTLRLRVTYAVAP